MFEETPLYTQDRGSAPETPLYHYVIVRADLSRGLQAANVVHAAGESSPGNLPEGVRAVCLTTPDEDALKEVADLLARNGVRVRLVVETEGKHAGQLMAVGCRPARREEIRRHVSSLPLLR